KLLSTAKVSYTEVVVAVQFSSTAPPADIPQADAVAITLRNAVSNSNNTFNLTVDASSIQAARKEAVVNAQVSYTEVVVAVQFSSTAPPADIPQADAVAITLRNAVSNSNNTFNLTVDASSIQAARKEAVVNAQVSYTEVVVAVQFSSTAPPADIPQADAVAITLRNAVSNSNNTFNLTVDASSIQAAPEPTNATATTTAATNTTVTPTTAAPSTANSTASPTPSAPVVIDVTATLVQPFVSQYTDKNSVQFVNLEQRVVQMEAVVNAQVSYTEVVVAVQFSSTAPPADIPQADAVAITLRNAVSNSNNTFNLTVDASSIQAARKLLSTAQVSYTEVVVAVQFSSTAPPADIPQADAVAITLRNAVSNSNNTFNLTVDASSIQAAPEPTNATATTTAATNTTVTPTTAAPSTANSTASPTPSAPVVIDVTATLVQPFVSQYTDKNSVQFVNLEQRVVQMEAVVNAQVSYTEVVVAVQFSSTAPPADIPQADAVAITLRNAVSNSNNTFNLTVDASSIQAARKEAVVNAQVSYTEVVVAVQFSSTAPPADIPQADAVAITLRNAVSNSNNTFNLTVDASSIQAARKEAVVNAQVSYTEVVVAVQFSSTAPPADIPQADAVAITLRNAVSNSNNTFNLTVDASSIQAARKEAVVNAQVSYTEVVVAVQFSSTAPPADIPQADAVAITLRNAVSNSNNTFNLTVDASSIQAARKEAVVNAQVSYTEVVVAVQFSSTAPPADIPQADAVAITLRNAVSNSNNTFNLTVDASSIQAARKEAVVNAQVSYTEVVVAVQFSSTAPPADIPQADAVAITLRNAVSNSNNTFNLTVDASSIQAARKEAVVNAQVSYTEVVVAVQFSSTAPPADIPQADAVAITLRNAVSNSNNTFNLTVDASSIQAARKEAVVNAQVSYTEVVVAVQFSSTAPPADIPQADAVAITLRNAVSNSNNTFNLTVDASSIQAARKEAVVNTQVSYTEVVVAVQFSSTAPPADIPQADAVAITLRNAVSNSNNTFNLTVDASSIQAARKEAVVNAQVSYTEVVVAVQFSSTAPPADIPQADAVAITLRNAVSNSNNTFNLTVDASSIQAARKEAVVNAQVSYTEVVVAVQFSSTAPPADIPQADAVAITLRNAVSNSNNTFNLTVDASSIQAARKEAVVNAQVSYTEVVVAVQFSSTAPPADIPQADAVAITLRNAVSNSNNTFNLTVDASSIQAARKEAVVNAQVSYTEVVVAVQFSSTAPPADIPQADAVAITLRNAVSNSNNTFNLTVDASSIQAARKEAVVNTQVSYTEVVVAVQFSSTAPPADIPQADAVAITLRNAVSNSNNTFNLTVDASSIQAARKEAVVNAQVSYTEVVVAVQFSSTAPPADIPQADAVAITLRNAVSNSNNTFNLTVDASSIQAAQFVSQFGIMVVKDNIKNYVIFDNNEAVVNAQVSYTEVVVAVQFSSTAPPADIPQADAVAITLRNAVSNSNNTFNLTVDASSIQAARKEAVVNAQVSYTEVVVAVQFSSTAPPADIPQADAVAITLRNAVSNSNNTFNLTVDASSIQAARKEAVVNAQVSYTEVVVAVQFSSTAPPADIPQADAVAITLRNAVSNSNNTFNLTVDASSIQAARKEAVVNTQVSYTEVVVAVQFSSTAPPADIPQADAVAITLRNAVSNSNNTFNLTVDASSIQAARKEAVVNAQVSYTEVVVAVQFSSTAPPADIPQADAVAITLRNAVSNSNNTFNLTVDASSIQAARKEAVVNAQVSYTEVVVAVQFSSTAPPADIPQADAVAITLRNAVSNSNNTFNLTVDASSIQAALVYHLHNTQYGGLLAQVFVKFFREAVVNTQVSYTEVVVAVQFSSTAPPADIPQADAVAITLRNAVSNSNNTFNLTVDASSIQAARKEAVVNTQVSYTEVVVAVQFSSTAPPADIPQADAVAITLRNAVSNSNNTFNLTVDASSIQAARKEAVVNAQVSYTEVVVAVQFSSTASPADIPQADAVAITLRNAVSNSNNTFNLTVDASSIQAAQFVSQFGIMVVKDNIKNYVIFDNNEAVVNAQVSYTEVVVAVQFSSTASPADIPQADAVAITLRNAVSNSNNTFNLTVDASSIQAARKKLLSTQVSYTEVVVAVQFSSTASPADIPQADAVAITLRNAVSNSNNTFNLTVDASSIQAAQFVSQFGIMVVKDNIKNYVIFDNNEAVVNTQVSYTEVVVAVQFSSTAPPADIPQADAVAITLRNAVSNSNNTFNLTVDASSIQAARKEAVVNTQVSYTEVVVAVQFSSTAPPADIPQADAVAITLRNAVSNSNNTFNLTVDASSIQAAQFVSQFGIMVVKDNIKNYVIFDNNEAVVNAQVSYTEVVVAVQFSSTASPADIPQADAVAITLRNAVSNSNNTFNLTVDASSIQAARKEAVVNAQVSYTEVVVAVQFSSTASPADIPQADAVAITLRNAVSNSNNTFNLTVDASSIQAARKEAVVNAQVSYTEVVVAVQFSSTAPPADIPQADAVAITLRNAVSNSNNTFNLTVDASSIQAARKEAVVNTQVSYTEVVVAVQFSSTAPPADIPQADAVAITLRNAVSNSNNTFNLTVDASSIQAARKEAVVNTQVSYTEVVVAVQFSSTAPPADIPQADAVAITLRNAVSNSNNTFNLTVDASSIQAARKLLSTQQVSYTEVVVAVQFSSTAPPADIPQADAVAITLRNAVSNSNNTFNLTVDASSIQAAQFVSQFGIMVVKDNIKNYVIFDNNEAVVNAQVSYTEVVVAVQFSSTAPPADIPQADAVAITLRNAVSNSNNTFNLTVDASSIQAAQFVSQFGIMVVKDNIKNYVIFDNNEAVVNTQVSYTEVVVAVQFSSTAPPADIPQADAVAITLRNAVSNSNNTFNLTVDASSIQAARKEAVVNAQVSYTEVVVAVQFSSTAPPADIPQADAVAITLRNAVSNSNNTFNLTVDASSIQAARKEAVVNTQVSYTEVVVAVQFSSTASPADIPQADAVAITIRNAVSNSNNTFNLTVDASSIQAARKEAMVKTRASETEAVVGVQFNDTAPPADIPHADAVAKTLRNAVSNSNNTFTLTVDASSIQAAEVSYGVSHKISVITASCLMLLSWLLTNQQ
ncbi:hypothetical protein Q5P01_000113, partial [Channa striata]